MDRYILDEDKNIVRVTDENKQDYFEFMKDFSNKRVAKTTIGDSDISTVFLGLDHSYDRSTPILFETLVFGGKLDMEMERYATWDEAVSGHEKMVNKVKEVK